MPEMRHTIDHDSDDPSLISDWVISCLYIMMVSISFRLNVYTYIYIYYMCVMCLHYKYVYRESYVCMQYVHMYTSTILTIIKDNTLCECFRLYVNMCG